MTQARATISSAAMHRPLCDGYGMACCYTCGSNADNHPDVVARTTLRPHAQPERGRCADWRAMPVRPIETRTVLLQERAPR